VCGITGFWQTNQSSESKLEKVATAMAEKLNHRGPDDTGTWIDSSKGIALAHTRLSILDLSDAGHQPMLSESGRYVLIFNGEIYNHLDMRENLTKEWIGHSDTETILASVEAVGIEKTLQNAVGMFSIVIWDTVENVLTLARDRMGEKPLYYGFQGHTLLFSSELKAMKEHPEFVGEIDRDVLCLYLRHSYVPAPFSIYKGINKLTQGTYIQYKLVDNQISSLTSEPVPYWKLAEVVIKGSQEPFTGTDSEAIDLVENQLKKSIKDQMISDVPLGAFLSGGVDSSLIVALMQNQSDKPIKTFSIGFNEKGYDEAIYAKKVAEHIGTEHTEHYVSWEDAMNVIPELANMYDEPFADSSQIPTYLVSKIARRNVVVSLSGDAGDELFCGYNRYLFSDKWKHIQRIPFSLRNLAGKTLRVIKPSTIDNVFKFLGKYRVVPANMGEKVEKLTSYLENVKTSDDLYYSFVSNSINPLDVVLNAKEPATWLTKTFGKAVSKDTKTNMMYLDAMTYLPDDILVKVDRAAMANSLETRVPFLDHRIIGLAFSLPMKMKLRNKTTKWILRQVLYKYVPKELIERPKAGFSIPVGEWIKGPLREWAEELINKERLDNEGYFDSEYIHAKWQEHLTGKRNWTDFLWAVLMFQLWLEKELK